MPRTSRIDCLPLDQRRTLEIEILNRGMADYDGIRAWADERLGLRLSRSAIGRHVQQLRSRAAVLLHSDLVAGGGDPRDVIDAAVELARLEVRRAELLAFLGTAMSPVFTQSATS